MWDNKNNSSIFDALLHSKTYKNERITKDKSFTITSSDKFSQWLF